MGIPIFVVTGFLDAGKTTFLNTLLRKPDWRDVRILLLQFEMGEEELESSSDHCRILSFPKRMLEQQPEEIIGQIADCMQNGEFDEIWVEWNGVAPFAQVQSLFLHSSLHNLCQMHRVLHIADAAQIENLLGRTGGALPEQIANCDFVVVRNAGPAPIRRRIRRLMRGINPGVKVYDMKTFAESDTPLFRKKENPVNLFLLATALIAIFSLAVGPVLEKLQIPVNTIINIFLGIILQAVPFLVIGVLLSSAIQVFLPKEVIERRFPQSLGMGVLVAVLSGFCLPVCDCASIPIFRSLVRKGIPLPVAVTFMTVTPVINPVVILSTYYAFGGNMTIVLGRICIGIAAAVTIGFIFAVSPPKGHILSGGVLDRLMCSCGCYEDADSITTFAGKVGLFLRHSQREFFSVGKYLMIGTFISAIFQMAGTGIFANAQSGAGLALSILIMMAMAFLLSLCSSSDAVIARSLSNQFPTGAIMGFLVFGPMMDIKNVMMLSSGFSRRFIGKLLLTAWIVCFAIVFLLFSLGGM